MGDKSEPDTVSYSAFDSEGKYWALAVGDRVRLWDVTTNELVVDLQPKAGKLGPVAISPNRKFVAVAVGTFVGTVVGREMEGTLVLFFLAGLQSIPKSLIEAAEERAHWERFGL